MRWWPQFRVIDTATVTPDPEIAALVATYEEDYARDLALPLATTAVELDSATATVRTREAAIGNLVADAMRASLHADVAIMNGGGIRAGKVYPAGATLTRGDVLAELPFNNRVVTLEVSGRDLRAAIENGLSLLPNPAGRFPHVSGIKVEAELGRPAGSRITAMTVGGAPLDLDKIYKVTTNDFVARGGDGYTMFRDAKRLLPDSDSPLLAREATNYLQSIGTLRTGVEGRVVVK
jgi:5'-nucleotidase/UDP-sugar diphosphatase